MLQRCTALLLLLGLCACCALGASASEAVLASPDTLLFDGVRFEAVEPLPDGGFLLVGCILKSPGLDAGSKENYHAWAARIDAQGNKLWEHTYPSVGSFAEAVRLADGTFLTGLEYVFQDFRRVGVVTLDEAGQLLGDPVPLQQSGFFYKGIACLVLVETSEGDGAGTAPRLRAVGARGETLWRQEFPSLAGSGYFVRPAADGNGYLLAGSIQDYPYDQALEGTYAFAAKLDKTGALLWQSQMSEEPGTGIRAFAETSDGGVAGVGNHRLKSELDDRPRNTGFGFSPDGFVDWYREYPLEGIRVLFQDLLLQPDGSLLAMGDGAARGGGLHLFQLDGGTGELLQQWHQPVASDGMLIKSRIFIAGEQLYHVCTFRSVEDDITSPFITAVMPIELP